MIDQTDNDNPGALSVDRFRTELEVFTGPLDLLLHLIRQQEVDILEVPLSQITDRYLAAVRTMEFLDINVAAEFLVVAATLMEIKSRTLLPPDATDEEEDEEDPGMELVRRLLEYRDFREAADSLAERAEQQSAKFPRPAQRLPDAAEEEEQESLLEDIAVWDLMAAFAEVVRQTQMAPTTRIIYSDVPVSVYVDDVHARLEEAGGPVQFIDLLGDDRSRPRVVGVFLALLELLRRKAIHVNEVARTRITIALRHDQDETCPPDVH